MTVEADGVQGVLDRGAGEVLEVARHRERGDTTVRCASIDSRLWWKTGRVQRSDFAIRNELSTCQRSW